MTEMKTKNTLEGITADHMTVENMDQQHERQGSGNHSTRQKKRNPKKNNEKSLKRLLG